MLERDARPALVDAARRLEAAGLNHNSSGNLSVRVDQHVLVTPTGVPAHVLRPEDLVLLDVEGVPVGRGTLVPTSEWRLHLLLHRRRPDIEAVVHTHSPEATAASTLGAAIPAVHYVVARFGSVELACAPYATYGTEELADGVASTLGATGMACLMANHGAVAVGRDLGAAVTLAVDLEWFCGIHRRARQLGEPAVLSDDEITRVAQRFTGYGQPGR
jgi:L-fuculose-phosphate aldolase